MTRYEKIRNMTIEEMAETLINWAGCKPCTDNYGVCRAKCYEGHKQWLEQEDEHAEE